MKTVEFSIDVLPEDAKVRGNAMTSGDDDFDKKCEDRILANLEDGNVWSWASVKVSACIQSIECSDYLGCCHYKDEADFRKDVDFLDMKGKVLSMLRNDCEGMMRAITLAEGELILECAEHDKRMAAIKLWRCRHCKDVVTVDPDYDDIPFCADCMVRKDCIGDSKYIDSND